MEYVELIEKLESLPPDKRAAVFDFVEFLFTRVAQPGSVPPRDWADEEFSCMAIGQMMRGVEHDPVSYSLADLKERWA